MQKKIILAVRLKKILPFTRVLILLNILFSISACSSAIITSKLDPDLVMKSLRKDILTTSELSIESSQQLKMLGKDPEAILSGKGSGVLNENPQDPQDSLKKIYANSEIALALALNVNRNNPEKAFFFYSRSARYALKGMLSPDCQFSINILCDNFKTYYLRSSIGILELLQNKKWQSSFFQAVNQDQQETYSLRIDSENPEEDPHNYQTISISGLIGLHGLTTRHVNYGAGLPLTVCRERENSKMLDIYLPKVGTCLPMTAVIDFEPAGNNYVTKLRLVNALQNETVNISGQKLSLAANFTAPFASLVEKTGLGNFDGFFSAFSDDNKTIHDTGFYTTESYDPNKIPLITVHGLFSSPITWLSLHNDLIGDSAIRKNYQIWHYLYPTNLPILQNASMFRDNLNQLQSDLQKNGSKGLQKMVVIAHSMGGLLTRTVIAREDKDRLNKIFQSPEKIQELPEEEKKSLSSILDFKRNPNISRVIFVAVPHRGSLISDNWIGWLGRKLLSQPEEFFNRTIDLSRKIRNMLRPELAQELENEDVTSIRGLSPSSPTIKILSEVAIDADIPFHSIIGNVENIKELEKSTDGVVDYKSAHLEGAVSELIVPADHSAHTSPEAVNEIKRILHAHLNSQYVN